MVKQEGGQNDLIDRLEGDAAFSKVDVRGTLDPAQFVGRAPEQVDEFIASEVTPIRSRYAADLTETADDEIRV